jgi:hypothetical protein
MGRQKIKPITPKSWAVIIGVGMLAVIALAWASYRFFKPLPPETLVMATGMAGGSHDAIGMQYQKILAREGIRLILRPTAGAVDNLKLLQDETQNVDAGLVQGIVGRIEDSSNLVSLGSLAYTPLWVFYRGNEVLGDLSELRGRKIAVGPQGSSARKFSLEVLQMAGVFGPPTVLVEHPYGAAKQALLEGSVDVLMIFSSADNPLVLDLLRAGGIRLMSIGQAEAYTRRFPDLFHVVLPRGVIDPAKRLPSADVHLLSPTTNLIVRKDLHPALAHLLLKAAVEIHGGSGWVNRAGEFPSLIKQDDPLSEQAQRFYKTGGSWLHAYLPFWMATFIDRITLILISIGMIIVPLIGIAPWIYTWRNRSKYYPWYRELRGIERELTENREAKSPEYYEARLNRIEEAVGRIRTSVAFYDELYMLKNHIQTVRQKLSALVRPPSDEPPEPKAG